MTFLYLPFYSYHLVRLPPIQIVISFTSHLSYWLFSGFIVTNWQVAGGRKHLTVAIQNKQLVCITFRMVSIRTSPVHQWAFSDKPRLVSLLIIFRIFRKWLIGVCFCFFFFFLTYVGGGPEIPESDEISRGESRTGCIFGSQHIKTRKRLSVLRCRLRLPWLSCYLDASRLFTRFDDDKDPIGKFPLELFLEKSSFFNFFFCLLFLFLI